MLLKVNDYDVTKIVSYSVLDDEPVINNTVRMADGSVKIVMAPYRDTAISVTLSGLTQAEFSAFCEVLDADNENLVEYYSEKENGVKTGCFYLEPSEYAILKKTPRVNLLQDYSIVFKKLREVN